MSTDSNEVPIGTLQAAQHLPADLMLVKMEGEHIMTMAAARKVHLPTLINEARELLEANPMAAHAAVYSKPVGMKPDVCRKCGHKVQRKSWQKPDLHCPKCGGQKPNNLMLPGKQQYARGLSIKAATSLANLVGYNRIASSFTPVDDGIYKVTSIFTDYSRGIIRAKERLVSQWRKEYGKTTLYKQDDERFLEMTLLGAQSKNERNTIIAGLPYELVQAYEQTAMEVAPKFLNADKINEMLEAFAEKGITLEDLQCLVGKSRTEGWTKLEYETMRGTWSALEQGEMTVEEFLKEVRPGPNDDPDLDDPTLRGGSAGAGPEELPPSQQAPRKTRGRAAPPAGGQTGTTTPSKSTQAANVASELTGATDGTEETPTVTPLAPQPTAAAGPVVPQERPAWLGLADMAGEAYSAGRFDFAARKYREAAGCHPSNSPDDPKVISLLKQAKACEEKADAQAEPPGPTVPPKSHQTTTTKRAPEPPAPAAPAPPGAPTAQRATITKPGPGQQPTAEKVQWTPDKCRQYINVQYSGEVENFDVDRLCEVAANQGAPQIFLDNMLRRINPNWANFTAKPKIDQQGPVGEDPPPEDDGAVVPPVVYTEEQLYQMDLTNPPARPPMISTDGQQFEKMIMGYKQPRRIDALIANDVEPADTLTNEEVAWLMFVARRKKRELAAIAQKAGNGENLPGMD